MSKFLEDTMQGLLEAAEIAKGNIPLTERENMPASTFYVTDKDVKYVVFSIINIAECEE